MAMRAAAVYDALRTANVLEDQARAAPEEIAAVNRDHVDLRGEFAIVKWMFGTLIVLIGGLYAVIFTFSINHASFH
jgi:hypothetical protein